MIEDKVYVAHGGLFRDPTPKQSKGHKAKRRRQGGRGAKAKLKLGSMASPSSFSGRTSFS